MNIHKYPIVINIPATTYNTFNIQSTTIKKQFINIPLTSINTHV